MAPILWSFNPGRFTTRKQPVDVVVEGEKAGRNILREGMPQTDVTVDMDADAALDLLMRTLLGAQ